MRSKLLLTQAQLNALACLGGYVKMDFVTQNAGVSGDHYALNTNIVGAVKEVPVVSSSFTPGVTGIGLGGLQADQPYFITVSWTGGNSNPTFTADWIAAHKASSIFEKSLCSKGQQQGTNAWCYFQTGSSRHSLTGGAVLLGGTYDIR
jgi:hypothetical protein